MVDNEHTPGWHSFLKLCQQAESPERLNQIFQVFLTPEEQVQLGQRIRLIKALLSGDMTQREIAAELHVSIAKITRGSNQLKRIDQPLKTYLQQTIED
ncbi:MAG: trp operon repressor [Gammaproteobacteria bacterium]|nr:trp operon repressor [Gammaproteobacteria bacterium]